jgi:metal-responsive CopG/Arc/MetJ family transcriptional regulator
MRELYAYHDHMKRISLFFPEPMLKWLVEYAEKHDLSFAEVVRDMLRKQIEIEKEKEKK